MRIGVVSDVHGNIAALEAALGALDGRVDEVWCAGDIVHEYRFHSETVLRLRDAGVTAILGNHDHVLLSAAGAGARARPGVDEEALAWLAALPYRHEATIDGRRVLMVHGSPWEPYGNYLSGGNPKWREAPELGVDVVVTGHTHDPFVERHGGTLVVNPGSLGEPRQRDRGHSYAVIDFAAHDAVIEMVIP